MSITVNIRYKGEGDSARRFAEEMMASGTVEKIRSEAGNIRYEYYIPLDDPSTILLIDSWENQQAIDEHHHSEMMAVITQLRNKYDLHMSVERFVSDDVIPETDEKYIKK